MRVFWILVLLSWGQVSFAVEMNDQRVLELKASNQGITRISVEGGEVSKFVMNPPSGQDDVFLADGHLFVMGSERSDKIYLSLITASGQVQDLSLRFVKKLAAPVILAAQKTSKVLGANSSNESQLKILRAFAKGNVPPGFRPLSLIAVPRVRPDLVARHLRSYGSDRLGVRVLVFSVGGKNRSLPQVKLFREAGDVSLAFSEKRLSEKTKLIVLQKLEKKHGK